MVVDCFQSNDDFAVVKKSCMCSDCLNSELEQNAHVTRHPKLSFPHEEIMTKVNS